MHKLIITLVALTLSVSSFARERGTITLNDGKEIIRIEVGKEGRRDNDELSQRIIRLERAVRELQNRVYDLEDGDRTRDRKEVACVLRAPFSGSFIGKASTELEARAEAVNSCRRSAQYITECMEALIKCETSN